MKDQLRSKVRKMILKEMEDMGPPISNSDDLKVKYTPSFFKNEENSKFFYTEKGLADGFVEYQIDGNTVKAKEIIGYFGGYGGEEDFEIIGHIYNTSQDIENYSDDQLYDFFISTSPSLSEEDLYEAKDDEEEIPDGETKETEETEEDGETEEVKVVDDSEFDATDETEEGSGDEDGVMSHLEAAMEAARDLGDEKLIDQLGNTITFYTRQHIAK